MKYDFYLFIEAGANILVYQNLKNNLYFYLTGLWWISFNFPFLKLMLLILLDNVVILDRFTPLFLDMELHFLLLFF